MIRIVTGCNERYYRKMCRWLDSLENRSNVPFTLVKVRWEAESGRKGPEVTISRAQNQGAPETTECIQHGSFLKVVPAETGQVRDLPLQDADEVIIYCDGDMEMQRPLSEAELNWLESFDENTVSAGPNRERETLGQELDLLLPIVDLAEIHRRFPGKLDKWLMLNVGVLAMRRSAWEKVYAAYMERWELVSDTLEHQARQQWLICYVIYTLGLNVQVMPYSMHVHGHFGLKPGMDVDGAVFRHAI